MDDSLTDQADASIPRGACLPAEAFPVTRRLQPTGHREVGAMPEVNLQHDGHPAFRRQVRFDWSNLPVHWVPGDPFVTHMINVLHLLLPGR